MTRDTIPQTDKKDPKLNVPVQLKEETIDNPGQGDCAFYAFAIGLIHIIQEEALYKSTSMFDGWAELTPEIKEDYDAICKIKLKSLENEDKTLLNKLQLSLRRICCDLKLNELKLACCLCDEEAISLQNNAQFNAFCDAYYQRNHIDNAINPYASNPAIKKAQDALKKQLNDERCTLHVLADLPADYNPYKNTYLLLPVANRLLYVDADGHPENIEFQSIQELKQILNKRDSLDKNPTFKLNTAPFKKRIYINSEYSLFDEEEKQALKKLFLQLIYGESVELSTITNETPFWEQSPIINELKKVQNRYHWGTFDDMEYLTQAFNVNLHVLINGSPKQRFVDRENHHTITLDNRHNMHWVTKITRAYCKDGHACASESTPSKVTPALIQLPSSWDLKEAYDISGGELQSLFNTVLAAKTQYIRYSNSLSFTIFHHHGHEGKNRAATFLIKLGPITDYQTACLTIADYLSNKNNGNTHPHSFRTMLLQQLLAPQGHLSLEQVSKNFEFYKGYLFNQLKIPLKSEISCNPVEQYDFDSFCK